MDAANVLTAGIMVSVALTVMFGSVALDGADPEVPVVDAEATQEVACTEQALTTVRDRVIGRLGLEIEERDLIVEHVEYAERRFQWGYQANNGAMNVTITWDAIDPTMDSMRLMASDRFGTELEWVGTSPMVVEVPVPGLAPEDIWHVDFRIEPLGQAVDEQPVHIAMRADPCG